MNYGLDYELTNGFARLNKLTVTLYIAILEQCLDPCLSANIELISKTHFKLIFST